jgi:putative transposase
LQLKLTIRVSPRTVAKYLHRDGPVRTPEPKQRWLTFVRDHAKVIVASDFFVVITAAFRTLYVSVIIEVESCKILHQNVTAHPTAEWTLQQLREALPGGHPYRFLIHDRDRIFAEKLDQGLAHLGVRALRTPVQAPKANAVCERLGGSLRRECLDFLMPFNERYLQRTVRDWAIHYNRGRPHSALGPVCLSRRQIRSQRAQTPATYRIPSGKKIRARRSPNLFLEGP